MAAELLLPTARATDANGNPYSGAQWFFYETGTTTPLAVYADAALAVSLGAVVTADSGGKFVPTYFDSARAYRGVLKNASGSVTLFDIDPINLTGYTGAVAGGATRATLASTPIGFGYQAVRTTGYAIAGDGGAADYVRISKADIDSAGYPSLAYFRSVDRYMPDGSTSPTNGGYWLVQPGPNGYDVLAFGAQIDNAVESLVDAADAVNAAAEMARITFVRAVSCPSGKFLYLTSAVDLTGLRFINFETYIWADPDIVEIPVEVGGFANSALVCNIRFAEITDGTSEFDPPPSRPILNVIGIKGSDIRWGTCNYARLSADISRGAEFGSTAYNRVYLDGVQGKLEIKDEGGYSWVNENSFYRSRILRLNIEGVGYPHNHNRFYEPVFEGEEVDITLSNCYSCGFFGVRAEGVAASAGVTCDADTYSHIFEFSWAGTGNPQDAVRALIPITDEGQLNVFTTEFASKLRKIELFTISPATRLVGTATDCCAPDPRISPVSYGPLSGDAILTPGLKGFVFPANAYIASSGLVPVRRGDPIRYEGVYNGDLIRQAVTVYGESLAPLLDEDWTTTVIGAVAAGGTTVVVADIGAVALGVPVAVTLDNASIHSTTVASVNASTVTLASAIPGGRSVLNGANIVFEVPFVDMIDGVFNSSHGLYAQGVDLASDELRPITVRRDEVRYVDAGAFSSVGGMAQSLSASIFVAPLGRAETEAAAQMQPGPLSLDGPPTRGIVPLHTAVLDRVSGDMLTATFRFDTLLSGGLAAGATSATVASATGIANGDIVEMTLDNGRPHWTTVSGLSGATFTIAAVPVGRTVPNNSLVRFIRWA